MARLLTQKQRDRFPYGKLFLATTGFFLWSYRKRLLGKAREKQDYAA
jgi:hypothetical protein